MKMFIHLSHLLYSGGNFAVRSLAVASLVMLAGLPLLPAGELDGETRYDIGEPTDAEQHYVELINLARAYPQQEALRYANTDNANILAAYSFFDVNLALMLDQFALLDPAPPVAINSKLTAAARGHSEDQAENAFQGHTGSDGSTPGDRVIAEGYSPSTVGENVFVAAESVWYGHVAFDVDWGEGADGSIGGMQDPPGHRLTIHNDAYREIGVGVLEGVEGEQAGGGQLGPQVVTQNFATASDVTPFITGVAYYDLNDDGFYDSGEGLGGVTVTVDGSDYYAVTSFSGGYAVPVPGDGDYAVTFSGTGLPDHTVTATVADGENVKVDYTPAYEAPEVSGPTTVSVGGTNYFEASAVGLATGYRWRTIREVPYTYVEAGGEGTAHVTIDASGGYEVIQSAVVYSGTNAFHLAHPDQEPQSVTLERQIVPESSSELTFRSRLDVATEDQIAQVQVSTDDGGNWESVWSQAGTNGVGEDTFHQRSVSLSGYAGEEIRLRFLYEVVPGAVGYYPATDTNPLYGWVIDEIAVSSAHELVDETVTTVEGDSLLNFSPDSEGTYLLQAAPNVGEREFPFGPLVEVTAVTGAVAPAITRHPESVVVAEGESVEFSVAASGSGTLSYQWNRNGDTISGETGSELSISSASLSDAGIYTVRVQSSDGGTVWSDEAELTITSSSSGFVAWQEEHFSEAELADSEISGVSADPGGFGVANLHRYAFGLAPEAPSRSGLPHGAVTHAGGNAYLTLTFRRLHDATGLQYLVEVSENLFEWEPADVTEEVIDSNSGAGTETVRVQETVPVEGATRFLRLRVIAD